MAVENLTATGAGVNDPRPTHGEGGTVKGFSRTVEITAAASDTSTYVLGYLPSNAKILGISTYSIDDCDTGSTATVDFGLFAVDANVTSDVDALNDGIVLGTAATQGALIKNIANYGKAAYLHVNGQTTDPGGFLQLKATIDDADVSAGGTLTVEVFYVLP